MAKPYLTYTYHNHRGELQPVHVFGEPIIECHEHRIYLMRCNIRDEYGVDDTGPAYVIHYGLERRVKVCMYFAFAEFEACFRHAANI